MDNEARSIFKYFGITHTDFQILKRHYMLETLVSFINGYLTIIIHKERKKEKGSTRTNCMMYCIRWIFTEKALAA